MDFTIPQEYQELQQRARAFIQSDLKEIEREIEEKGPINYEIAHEVARRAVKADLWAPFGPKAHGVGGIESALAEVLFWEAMGETLYVFGHRLMGNSTDVLEGANDYQKQEFLIPMLRGEKIGPYSGMTEPGAGSDVSGYKTTAAKDGDNWILNGVKCYISLGDAFDFGFFIAVVDEQTRQQASFYISNDNPGLEIINDDSFLTLQEANHPTIRLKNCVVPDAARLRGRERGGAGRANIAARILGAAQNSLDLCIRFVKNRETFGAPLATKQSIQWRLVDSAMDIHAARLVIQHAAWKADQGENVTVEAAMAKIMGFEAAERVARRVIQCMGGRGLSSKLPVERVLRDALGGTIYSGSSDIMRLVIARRMLGHYVKY